MIVICILISIWFLEQLAHDNNDSMRFHELRRKLVSKRNPLLKAVIDKEGLHFSEQQHGKQYDFLQVLVAKRFKPLQVVFGLERPDFLNMSVIIQKIMSEKVLATVRRCTSCSRMGSGMGSRLGCLFKGKGDIDATVRHRDLIRCPLILLFVSSLQTYVWVTQWQS